MGLFIKKTFAALQAEAYESEIGRASCRERV